MPNTPFDPDPAAPGSLTRQFIRAYGSDPDGNKVPLKTLRITNNTTQTVYPIMRDPNSATLEPPREGTGLYDPYDDVNREYRGYIGYEEGGKYYFGVKSGDSILVSIPLVFWDSGRIAIETGSHYLTPSGNPNPLRWNANSKRSITSAEKSGDTIPNGVVMWYRADIAEAPTDDTEDQLAEFTFRDHDYLVNPQITARTNGEISFTQLVSLANYDVSNVDTLYLPLAFAANNAWVLPQKGPTEKRTDWSPGSIPDPFGWIGAINPIEFLQKHIRAFAKDDQLLGQYFGTKGWPFYNIPSSTPGARVKIPSGANVFAQSPLRDTRSSYDNNKYMLSSGGGEPIEETIGWAGGTPDEPPSTTLHLNLIEKDKIAFIHKGYSVVGRPPAEPPTPNPIQDGTTVTAVDYTEGTVTLSKPLVASSKSCAFTFGRPVDDYASDAMIKLWYSWAQYYLKHWNEKTPGAPTETTIRASIDAKTATLTFKETHNELVEGMAVRGDGLDNAQTEVGKHQGDAVILQIAPDKKSVILSQVVASGYKDQAYTFHAPEKNPLLWTPKAQGDPGYPLIVFDPSQFSGEPDWHDPYKFSQQVYLIMASMNQIGEFNNDSVSKNMQNIVGGNMGFIFANDLKGAYDSIEVTGMIRDMIKSVLRGVTDFTEFPDTIVNGKHTVWYPDPTEGKGGQAFNVFNLDPYVWFVHVVLGFTGYGFSLDDDTADVGAGGASHLQLSVTGKGGLENTDPWAIQAPYGPVGPLSLPYGGQAETDGKTVYVAIESVSNTTPITVTTVNPHLLSNGDTVLIEEVRGDPAANGKFTIGNVTRKTFDLYVYPEGKIAVSPTGDYTGGGKWGYPLHPYVDTGADLAKVFERVKGDEPDGTFQGAFVSVNGVDKDPKDMVMFRVFRHADASTGRLLLSADLTDASGNPLGPGTYTFTFFGVVPTK